MKHFFQNLLFAQSRVYFSLGFLPFGLMGILPVSIQTYPGVSSTAKTKSADVASVEKIGKNTDERCRLQADVANFLSLQNRKSAASAVSSACEKWSPASDQTRDSTSLHSDEALDIAIRSMTAGYPVEKMAPAIARYDRSVAALIVGIAKKESDWGKHSPRDQKGADCFNYWGYKGAGSRGMAMGHGCFGTPEEAVNAVGDRLKELVALRQTSEPGNMTIWKCGSSCKGQSVESVKKWIADVSLYYHQIALK